MIESLTYMQPQPATKEEKIKIAAEKFSTLFIEDYLKTAHVAVEEDDEDESGQTEMYNDLMWSAIAVQASKKDAFGIVKTLTSALTKTSTNNEKD